MSYTLNHTSSRQIVRDYTQLRYGIKRKIHKLFIANDSHEYSFTLNAKQQQWDKHALTQNIGK
ncbi:hypothetical protein BED42_03000 [Citrobacter portucalensis]|nr:hypothetical protein BED42_03000 [Citrobacter portucalensis]